MIDAAYFARALWGNGRTPDAERIGKARKRAIEFGVSWEDIDAFRTAQPAAPSLPSGGTPSASSPVAAPVAAERPKTVRKGK